ncbi:hypothetical protein BU24DRAFT_60288 [Aaosphaeria arxii CBS 175.79]|uniref:Secreted protein n=1 Tax=Aaosphaeria arxii CBS 175.79 TaxID=1450172 RepID=A0A6A5XCA8_9PLEO|nr:uncharacterized protein BU24DRAFT_60288 [Aaosphaeria arxii CBS 175.79]KAF2010533.1 hypothetical protein BU24DRAFT_60288 [Aaosphaeria arxii CBS 175.79]
MWSGIMCGTFLAGALQTRSCADEFDIAIILIACWQGFIIVKELPAQRHNKFLNVRVKNESRLGPHPKSNTPRHEGKCKVVPDARGQHPRPAVERRPTFPSRTSESHTFQRTLCCDGRKGPCEMLGINFMPLTELQLSLMHITRSGSGNFLQWIRLSGTRDFNFSLSLVVQLAHCSLRAPVDGRAPLRWHSDRLREACSLHPVLDMTKGPRRGSFSRGVQQACTVPLH